MPRKEQDIFVVICAQEIDKLEKEKQEAAAAKVPGFDMDIEYLKEAIQNYEQIMAGNPGHDA